MSNAPPVPSSSATATASGHGPDALNPDPAAPEAVAPGPYIFIIAGNYSMVESSGKPCETKWGGLGGTAPNTDGRSFGFTLEGGSGSWAETFEYSTFEKPEGEANWAGSHDANAVIKDKLRSTYRVSSRCSSTDP